MLKSWRNFYRRKFKTRISCEIFDPLFPLDRSYPFFLHFSVEVRTIVPSSRGNAYIGDLGESYFISVSRPEKDGRTRNLHSKPWPESLVIRSAANSLNEAPLNSLSRFARLPGRFFAKSTTVTSSAEDSRLAHIKQYE